MLTLPKQMSLGFVLAVVASFASLLLAGSTSARPSYVAPTISSFAPRAGVTGTRGLITGANFTGSHGGHRRRCRRTHYSIGASGMVILATVPAHGLAFGSAYPISVTTPEGTATTTLGFAITAAHAHKNPMPRIMTFWPATGPAGTRVTVIGQHLGGAIVATIGGARAHFMVPKSTKLVIIVPGNARTGKIGIQTTAGTGKSGVAFTVA